MGSKITHKDALRTFNTYATLAGQNTPSFVHEAPGDRLGSRYILIENEGLGGVSYREFFGAKPFTKELKRRIRALKPEPVGASSSTCPTCGVPSGERCKTSTGNRSRAQHKGNR